MNEERKAKLCRELELLQLPKWHWKEICEFVGCASAKAVQIKKQAIELGGKIDYDPHGVQSRYVLKLLGTTPEIEINNRVLELKLWAEPTSNESKQQQPTNRKDNNG